MIVSGKGRSYERGKAVGIELRKSVIDMIVKEGGDITTGTFTGSFKNVAQHFSLSVSFVCKLWKQCCKTGDLTAQWKGGNNPPHLGPPELELIQCLKTSKPSLPYAKILDTVNANCIIPGGTSKSAIGRAVKTRLDNGNIRWSWKRLCRAKQEKFIPENIDYCQDFLNYLSGVDPCKIKCFDEAGFRLPDCSRPNYGHSQVNTPCIEIGRYLTSPNVTLNLLMGLQGVLYANTVDTTSNTESFLNFWGEAYHNRMPNGQSILHYGDIIVLDNCPIHHNEGGYHLSEWLYSLGIDVVYLPVYSPEFNPCELVFNKLKTLAKRDELRTVFSRNVHEGIYQCLEHITADDCVAFYRHTDYLAI